MVYALCSHCPIGVPHILLYQKYQIEHFGVLNSTCTSMPSCVQCTLCHSLCSKLYLYVCSFRVCVCVCVPFQPELAQELRNVTASTVNTRRNRGMYRNLLFYGPPGTGKTLFAKVCCHALICISVYLLPTCLTEIRAPYQAEFRLFGRLKVEISLWSRPTFWWMNR